jgi:thymidylate synthase (FAD)
MQILDKGSIELVDHMGNDLTVVNAARVSVGGGKGFKSDTELINYLIANKHTSPFEHVIFQFLIKCPLFVRSQWHRHRTWSYNEISRRYTSEQIQFHIPDKLRLQNLDDKQSSDGFLEHDEDLIKEMENMAYACESLYNGLLECGVAREQAREVLPVSLYTSFYGTVDLHNLFGFLELRNSPHAQLEIKVYAQAIEQLIEPIVPISYKAWKNSKLPLTKSE